MDDEKILVTIAARGGSKGVKDKNIRELYCLPLIAYTILQAKKWNKASRVICSTDSERIAEVARSHGAEILFMRPPELASDTAGKIGVIRHAVHKVEEITKERFDVIVDLDATAPIRSNRDLDGALALFKKKRPKTLFSVTPCRKNPYFNMVELGKDGFVHLAKELPSSINRRQDAPKVYDMNASIYIYDREYLLDENSKSAISDRSIIWEMDELSAIDIDQELDFQFVEFLISKGIVKL
jgi:CMP-N-acetylneuraminic acid synthetase